jgi:hypothetical protein
MSTKPPAEPPPSDVATLPKKIIADLHSGMVLVAAVRTPVAEVEEELASEAAQEPQDLVN